MFIRFIIMVKSVLESVCCEIEASGLVSGCLPYRYAMFENSSNDFRVIFRSFNSGDYFTPAACDVIIRIQRRFGLCMRLYIDNDCLSICLS